MSSSSSTVSCCCLVPSSLPSCSPPCTHQQPPVHSHTLTTHSTLFTRCAPSGQHQHHLYSHPGTHRSLSTSTGRCTLFTRCAPSGQHQHHLYSHPGHSQKSIHIYRWVYTIHPLFPLWTTPTPPLQSPGHSHKSIHIYRWVYTIHPLCPLLTTPTPRLQSPGHSKKSTHIYRWAYSPIVPPLDNTNTTSTVTRALTQVYTHLQVGIFTRCAPS